MTTKTPRDAELWSIVYDSVAVMPFGRACVTALADLVTVARTRNAEAGITGVLHFDGAYFMQVLEGAGPAVEAAFDRIQRDTRHSDIRLVARGPLTARDFAGWSMVLVDDRELTAVLEKHRYLPRAMAYRAPEFIAMMRAVLSERQA